MNTPGAQICLVPSPLAKAILIKDVFGDADSPVTVSNCDGQVVMDASGYNTSIDIVASRYVHLTGSGSADDYYGIVTRDSNDRGLNAHEGSSDIEVSYIEITDTGNAALTIRSYPFSGGSCRPEFGRDNFTQYNTKVHHVKIRDAGAEGMYIGTSHYAKRSDDACPHEASLIGVEVHNNLINGTHGDGIQIGAAISGVEVYDNVVLDYGRGNLGSHSGGIQINSGTNGNFFNNILRAADGSTNSNSVQYVGGEGPVSIYNNLFMNTPRALMTLNRMPNSSSMTFVNNTVIGGSGGIFHFFCDSLDGEQDYLIKNNLFADYDHIAQLIYADNYSYFNGQLGGNCPINGAVFRGHGIQDQLEIAGNLYAKNPSNAGFQNPQNENYRLRADSPAVDSGEDFSHLFSDDLRHKTRDSNFDIGAYEY